MKINNMKKILFVLLLVCTICTSCGNECKVNKSSMNTEKIVLENNRDFRVTEFTYKGHDYIFMKNDIGRYATAGLVHDPNCECFNK